MNMRGVLLDQGSLGDDINLSTLRTQFSDWHSFENSNPSNVLERIQQAHVVISNKVILDAKTIQQCPELKLICVAATGYNNIDLEAAKAADIAACNVTGYATASVVQHVFSLMLSLQTHLCEYRKKVTDGEWQKSEHFCLLDDSISELAGKTLGIVGYGELGKAVEKVAIAFGMHVLIAESLTGKKHNNRTPLNELLQVSDIVTLHCPLSDKTENLINYTTLKTMKPSACLINTARGRIINENDLAKALEEKIIAGAGLDVLSTEPPKNNVLLEKERRGLIITPHIAWASRQSRQRLVNEITENIKAFNAGELRNRLV